MGDNNLTTSTSAANEELEKPSAQHNVVHQHHHVVQQSTRNELIEKLGGEAQPLGLGLPVPVVVPQPQLASAATKNVTTTGNVGLTLESPSPSTTILAEENDLGSGDSSDTIIEQDERTSAVVPMDDTPASCESGHGASGSTAGAGSASSGTELISKIDLEIAPSIGDCFQLKQINYNENVNNLKKIIINKLKLQSREQISLLYRDKVLAAGLINDYGICNGSRITLLPSIETGLLTQRPEQSVLEALEGLNETQINDFLSGKSPLNLTMRLGEHVMLIQLQLSKGQALAAAAAAASHSKQSQASTSSGSSSKTTSISKSVPSSSTSSSFPPKASEIELNSSASTTPNPTLAEASRNLTKTLKRISSKVNKVTGTTLATHSKHHRTTATSGGREVKCDDEEIINLKHHGKGVYSGTFSGTLNPALQDNLGKPRKHVSTIVHILNDLLGTIDLRSADPNGEIGLKSASIGASNSLKRKKVSNSKPGSSSSSALTNTHLVTCESTDSEESHDSCSAKPAVALKLPKLSSKEGAEQSKATSKNNQSGTDAISKDEENRLLRLKIEKLKENLLARKLKRNS